MSSQGEKSSAHRLLRSVKNRFGSTDEVHNGTQAASFFIFPLLATWIIDLFVIVICFINLISINF